MPECRVCGENEYEEHNGLYFCTICSTQSQDIQVMEADELLSYDHSARVAGKKKKLSRKHDLDVGRPWSIYEAYEIILLHQVEVLIQLGAQPKLKDIVFKLWANYLNKIGVAFSDEPVNALLQKYSRQREMFPGTTFRPKIKNVLGRQSIKVTTGVSRKESSEKNENELLARDMKHHEFDADDDPLAQSNNDTDDDWHTEDETEQTTKFWRKRRKCISNTSVLKIKMISTLSLCYIGLMQTNPLVTLADLVRWASSGKLPYRDGAPLLPDDMKFCNADWKLFGMGHAPPISLLLMEAGRLCDYLGVKPVAPCMYHLVNKYIIALDLPSELHGYAINILSSLKLPTENQNKRRKKFPFYEGIAMAVVVVSMKVILGLNDLSEREMCDRAHQLEKLLLQQHCDVTLFKWNEWVKHIKEKTQVSELWEHNRGDDHTSTTFRRIEAVHLNDNPNKKKAYKPTTIHSILEPLNELSCRWEGKKPDSVCQQDTPENLLTSHDTSNESLNDSCTLDDAGETVTSSASVHNSQPAVTAIHQQAAVKRRLGDQSNKLRSSTIQYLIDPREFHEYLRQATSDDDQSTPTDLKSTDSHARKKRRKEKQTRKRLFTNLKDVTKYREIIHAINESRNNLLVAFDHNRTCTGVSYSLLLDVCSRLIVCSIEELQKEVAKIEVTLFSSIEEFGNSKKKYHGRRMKNGGAYLTKAFNLLDM